jgi:hypothetical protein
VTVALCDSPVKQVPPVTHPRPRSLDTHSASGGDSAPNMAGSAAKGFASARQIFATGEDGELAYRLQGEEWVDTKEGNQVSPHWIVTKSTPCTSVSRADTPLPSSVARQSGRMSRSRDESR